MIQKTCQKCRNVFPANKTTYDDSHGDMCPGCAEEYARRKINPWTGRKMK